MNSHTYEHTYTHTHTVSRSRTCAAPALFGHAHGDELVLPTHSRDVHAVYGGPKEIMIFEGDHNSVRPEVRMVVFCCVWCPACWTRHTCVSNRHTYIQAWLQRAPLSANKVCLIHLGLQEFRKHTMKLLKICLAEGIYACVCVCVYVCIYTHTYICMYIYTCAWLIFIWNGVHWQEFPNMMNAWRHAWLRHMYSYIHTYILKTYVKAILVWSKSASKTCAFGRNFEIVLLNSWRHVWRLRVWKYTCKLRHGKMLNKARLGHRVARCVSLCASEICIQRNVLMRVHVCIICMHTYVRTRQDVDRICVHLCICVCMNLWVLDTWICTYVSACVCVDRERDVLCVYVGLAYMY